MVSRISAAIWYGKSISLSLILGSSFSLPRAAVTFKYSDYYKVSVSAQKLPAAKLLLLVVI